MALKALIECALMKGKAGKLVVVKVALSDNSTLLVIAFFFGLFYSLLNDRKLEVERSKELFCENRHGIVDHNLLLAARAVQVAKRDA